MTNNIPNNFYRTSIKALVMDDEKRFLLLLENNGLWELPGGGLDFGEKPYDCLVRELHEEMGVEVTYVNKQPSYFVTALRTEGRWKSNVLYETELKDLKFTPSDECTEIRFFTKEEALKETLYPIVREFIKEYDPANHEQKKNIVQH